MRFRTALVAMACGVSPSLSARVASATDCSGPVSPCINADTLWSHAGPARFVAVGSTETVRRERLGFGLASTYLSRPIVIHVRSPGGAGSDQYAVNDLANGTFLWAYGVSDRLELDLALPLTYGQGGTGLAPVTGGAGLNDTAARDMRFGFAYALLSRPRGAAASGEPDGPGVAARFEVSAPTGDRSQFAGEGAGVFVPGLAADYRAGRVFAGAEVGARIRPTAQLLGASVGTQVLTAIGVGVDVLPRALLSAVLEAWALPTLAEQGDVTLSGGAEPGAYGTVPNGKHIVPAEWQLSARTAPLRSGDLAIQLGGGGAVPFGSDSVITAPRFRFTLGVRWAPSGPALPPAAAVAGSPAGDGGVGPVDLRLASSPDRCADEPDLVDGFKDGDGCPDEDQDRDGIDDRLDQCPLVAEDFVGLSDGCPEKKAGAAP
jgi:OOP family OmpA-OmpF porin